MTSRASSWSATEWRVYRARSRELLKLAPDRYDITVFGAEPHPNYNRILLSPVLAGEQTLDADHAQPIATGTQRTASRCTLGKEVVKIDRARAQVRRATDGTAAPTTACCWQPARARSFCRSRATTCRA